MRIRGLVIALSVSLPLSLAACNIYFDEGDGHSNHPHHHGPDGGSGAPQDPDAFPGWGPDGGPWQSPDASWDPTQDAGWGPTQDAGWDPSSDGGVQTNDAGSDDAGCATLDAMPADAHTCGC